MPSKADILAALRADISALEASATPEAPSFGDAGRSGTGRTASRPKKEERALPTIGGAPTADEDEKGEGVGKTKTAQDAYQKILRWAAVRERSSAYVRERLLKDDFGQEAVEEALERAVRVRVVDDRRYADALVRMRLSAGRGLRDAEREIESLGIDPTTLDAWAEHAQKGRDHEVERALASLRRRPPRAKRAREAAFRRLASQGFSTDVASTAARRWDEERPREA